MKMQSSHSHEDRGLDAYFTPIEATLSLIEIEKERIPTMSQNPNAPWEILRLDDGRFAVAQDGFISSVYYSVEEARAVIMRKTKLDTKDFQDKALRSIF